MRKSKPEWGRIKRALKDPRQDFVCHEEDLDTPEGLRRHQGAFMADEWIRSILDSEDGGEVWLEAVRIPLPVAYDWATFIKMRRVAFYALLLAALRLRWREEKQKKRDARRLVPLDDVNARIEPPAEPLCLDALFDSLTEREEEVALLLAAGATQAEIATELDVTPGRVSQILASLRHKLTK